MTRWCTSPAIPAASELERADLLGSAAILVPVHGEALHLLEQGSLATRCRHLQCPVPQRRHGAAGGRCPAIDEVPAGRVYKDGTLLGAGRRAHRRRPPTSLLCRRGVGGAGTHRGRAVGDRPGIRSDRYPGARPRRRLDARGGLTTPLSRFESLPRGRRRDPDAVAEAVRRAVRAAARRALGQEADVPCACLAGMMGVLGSLHERESGLMIGRLNHVAIAVQRHRQGEQGLQRHLGRRGVGKSAAAGPRRHHRVHHAAQHQDRAAGAARARIRRSPSSSTRIPTAASITSATKCPTSAPPATR